jgi:hypothetical protein
MFLTLLLVTLGLAAATSYAIARAFDGPVRKILARLVSEELAPAWARYVRFAILVVGVSGGVRIYSLERYVTSRFPDQPIEVLNADRWVLEVYGTLIGTLQGVAWMLLVFFLVALIAYVLVRGFELRRESRPG